MGAEKLCACGRPLHYSDSRLRALVEEQVRLLGEDILVTTPRGSWLVPRHYIALHGLRADDLPASKFPQVKGGPFS